MRLWVIALCICTALAGEARAQQQRIGGQRFTPAGSEDGIFATEGADRRPVLWPYVALWAHYAWSPIVVVDGNGNTVLAPVEHAFAADLAFSIAVWEGLEFGLVLPVTLYSAGDAFTPEAPGTALGDLSLRVAYRIRITDEVALAFHVPVLFPTNASDNMLALGWGARPTIALLLRGGPVEFLFNVFVLIREDAALADYRGGHEFGSRAGLRFDLTGRWQTALLLEAEFATAFASFFGAATTPAEARFGLEHWFDRNWRISGFIGTGIGPGVGAPDVRGGLSIAFGDNDPYRPRRSESDGDRDGDGVLDSRDRCPNRAEDRDGYRDRDGCPETDADQDGVLDWDDRCPEAPGARQREGCPQRVRVEGSRIVTFEDVRFRSGSDEIDERSHPLLNEVAAVMRASPDMRVRIDGHADAAGNAQQNLELSRQRAASVRRYLISRGIAPGRLRSRGFGEARPEASNETARGRRRNRRVEFHIIGGR